jgi:hypothetical protein
VSDEKAKLPEPGEQLTFDPGDGPTIKERVTIRVMSVESGGFGYMTLVGFQIGADGFPFADIRLNLSVASIEARRVHRRRSAI